MKPLLAVAIIVLDFSSFSQASPNKVICPKNTQVSEKQCTDQGGVKCVFRFSALAAQGNIDICCNDEDEKNKFENLQLEGADYDAVAFERCRIE
jgi:hypothetical protein